MSTTDQDLAGQREALERAGCTVIRAETASGGTTAGRGELRTVLDFLGPGDELVVTRVDRLARSVGDLQDVVRELSAKGASLRCTEQLVDTGTAAGKAFLDMLGVFAEFETALRRERQMEGIARAKAQGVYKGRKLVVDPAQVCRLHAEGVRPSEIARRLGVGRTTVWRAQWAQRTAVGIDQDPERASVVARRRARARARASLPNDAGGAGGAGGGG